MKKEFDTEKKYYVYKWFNTEDNHVFYVGKGSGIRASRKSLGSRNRYFVRYVNAHSCSYQIVEQNLNEEEALQKEYQLIRYYKNQGECECNFEVTDDYTGHAHLIGSANGMWHKTHSKETKQKLSEINSDGRHKGQKNSQYGVSPKERMDENQYKLWIQHRSNAMKNGKNSRARKVELYNSQYELIETFDCIKNCAIYLNTKLPTPKNLDHLRHMILKHSKEKTIYNNYYFQIQE